MKILKVALLIGGVALVVMGLNQAFFPETDVSVGVDSLEVNKTEGLNSQTLGMIGIGVLALLGGAFIKKR
ncbi:MAG TPA: hypothetical protein VKX34_10385 [Aequorivita sp.]|nr:hypothetical protein [Aequorivita sp.]